MKTLTFLSCALALLPLIAEGQDIRGGEIRHDWLSGFTHSFEIVMYTNTMGGADHSMVVFDYGDGTFDTISGTSYWNLDITVWNYTATHTFPGAGIYITSLTDSFRMAAIENIVTTKKFIKL